MKIAVIGVYYASNLGDAVICDCAAAWLKEKYPLAQIDIIDMTGKEEFETQESVSMRILRIRQRNLSRDYWLTRHGFDDKVYYWSRRNLESRLNFYRKTAERNYDFAVFAGGQLFMDWLSLDMCEFLKYFEQVKTPVYFNACGAGISISSKIREELKQYLNTGNVRFISTRDDAVEIRNRYLTENKQIISTYDPALWTKEVYQPAVKKEDVVGLGVMYCSQIPLRKLIRFWIRLIKEMDKRNIRWKMFCNGAIDDYNLGRSILEKLNLDPKEYLCECADRPEKLVDQIAGFASIISFRLHSHIIAASLDVPGIAVVWDDKLRFFYKHLGHEERCMTTDHSPEEILHQLECAVREGYDRELIQKQKDFAKNLLLDAIEY